MNETLKAVVIELSHRNVRDHQICLRGVLGLFPDDCFSASGDGQATPITVQIARETVKTDIDEGNATFRERNAIKRFFEEERVSQGDLIVIERLEDRDFRVWKTSKRAFKFYL